MFEIYRDNGEKLFDANHSNFSLKLKTTISGTAIPSSEFWPFNNSAYRLISFAVSDVLAPFVCWRNDSGAMTGIIPLKTTFSGANVTYYFAATNTNAVTFYVFDFTHKAVASPLNYGLQTYDNTGRLTLDILQCRLLKVVAETSANITAVTPPTPVPSGKKYAIGITIDGMWITQMWGTEFRLSYGRAGADPTNAALNTVEFYEDNPGLSEESNNVVALVVDVTGY